MKTSIMLVEDHAGFRRSLRSLLSHESWLVVGEAADGVAAVALAKELRPDIIVMDLVLPGMSGLDAIRRIRADDPAVLVLVLTMHADGRICDEAFAAGATAFVSKSAPPATLLEVVQSLVDRLVESDQQERPPESDMD